MTLHPQARAYLEALGSDQAGPPLDHEAVRGIRAQSRAAALEQDRIGLDHVADVDADGVPCRLYRPRLGAPVALYVHGGGWVMHDVETHDVFCRYLAHVTGWALLSVDYRLAPEHPFPAGLDDVERAARWLRANGRGHRVDTDWVPAIGDSAGANLVAGLCVRDPALVDHQVGVKFSTNGVRLTPERAAFLASPAANYVNGAIYNVEGPVGQKPPNPDMAFYSAVIEQYGDGLDPIGAGTVSFRSLMNLYAIMNQIDSEITPEAVAGSRRRWMRRRNS